MTAPALTGAQKSHLRSLGQTLDCRLTIGREGITAAVVVELENPFTRHELIKVKLLAERDERPALCATIEEKTGAAEAVIRANPEQTNDAILIAGLKGAKVL